MTETIKEIEQKLAKIEDLNSAYFTELLEDTRAGVHKAVIRRQKQIQAAIAEDERLDKMLYFEREVYDQGQVLVAGIDEVGRGPLAGPVIAAAVILPVNCKIPKLNDSKQIPKKHRQEIFEAIQRSAIAIGLGIVSPEEIDQINIYQAARKAMLQAVENLSVQPEHLLIDAMHIDSSIPQTSMIKGDAKSMSIAAASIVAKVTRDQIMADYAKIYPDYDFEHNAGYGTAKHLEGLKKVGITPIHRKTFEPIASMLGISK